MKQRGRKSSASMEVSNIANAVIEVNQRPSPPSDMPDDEAEVWRDVVNRMPATWFGAETLPLLVQYARHSVRSDKIAQLIIHSESLVLDIKEYDKLLRMQQRETLCLATLATKMRLAQQSTMAADKKHERSVGAKLPWQE